MINKIKNMLGYQKTSTLVIDAILLGMVLTGAVVHFSSNPPGKAPLWMDMVVVVMVVFVAIPTPLIRKKLERKRD